jgi:threonine dehydrogenase-like Zn-dependent dehydrogenase
VIDEVTLVGSRCGPFDAALRLLAAGTLDPTPLISRRIPLARGLDALDAAADPANVKVLLSP